jgi:23S rRNA A2030 N6-methylase RlmJ
LSERDASVFQRLDRWVNNQAGTVIFNSDGFDVAIEAITSLAQDTDYIFFIDPAYEHSQEKILDYDRIVDFLSKARPIAANIMIGITYPAATERDFANLCSALKKLPSQVRTNLVCSELRFHSPRYALRGAGLLLVNAPQDFMAKARSALFMLAETLHLKRAHIRVWKPSQYAAISV